MGDWIDYYEILGIDRNADAKTIKKRYRKLAKKYHPDLNEGNLEAEEMFKKVNEAYHILSDETKKREYDQKWDAHQNGAYVEPDTNEVNYEDIKNQYTAEERRYAKREALKQVIEEELQKAEIVINSKNEIIFAAYTGRIDKREYYQSVKELVSIGSEYIGSLLELAKEAYKYDLLQEEELIHQTVEFLDNELQSIPLSPKDTKVYVEDEAYKVHVKEWIEKEIARSNTIREKIASIYVYCYSRQITHLEYNTILTSVLLEAKDAVSTLNELCAIASNLGLDAYFKMCTDEMARLQNKIQSVPKTYDDVIALGEKETFKDKIKTALQTWSEYEKKIRRIAKLLEKYPNSRRYEGLYIYCLSLYEELATKLKGIGDEVKSSKEKCKTKQVSLDGFAKDAKKLYEDAENLHQLAQSIYEQTEEANLKDLTAEQIITLSKSAYAAWNKGEALKKFVEAKTLVDSLNLMLEEDAELERLYFTLLDCLRSIPNHQKNFEKKYKVQRTNTYQGSASGLNLSELADKIIQIKEEISAGVIATSVGFLISAFSGSYPVMKLLDNVKNTGFENVLSVILGLFAISGMSVVYDYVEQLLSLCEEKEKLEEAFENLVRQGKGQK